MRFIQGYAVDHILALAERVLPTTDVHQNLFSRERRYERRHPGMVPVLPDLLQGYGRNRESAQAALAFLDEHFEINEAMKARLLKLCESCDAPRGS